MWEKSRRKPEKAVIFHGVRKEGLKQNIKYT
jgi:hypothetical protein